MHRGPTAGDGVEKEKKMSEGKNPSKLLSVPTRRRLITGVAMALGGLAMKPGVWASAQENQEKIKEAMSTGVEGLLPNFNQGVELKRAVSEFMMRCWIPSSLRLSLARPPRSAERREVPFLSLVA